MNFYGIKNLIDKSLFPCNPWEFSPTNLPSVQIRSDKQSRQEWYRTESTNWNFYTPVEPTNPNIRVSKENPPRVLHGFAADYDIAIPRARVIEGIASMPHRPQWIEQSLGGNTRLVWVFSRGVPVDCYDFCCYILQNAIKWLRLGLLPALDEGAFTDPARLLCNGASWVATEHPPISESALQSFLVECGKEFRFKGTDTTIPLDIVEGCLRKQYPDFDWPTEFVLESQGPSFWVPGSVSPLSAIVKQEGMFTFSAHAEKSFYPWSELIGAETIQQFTQDAIAKSTTEVWWDRKRFWRRKQDQYVSCDLTELLNYFKVNCRLSSKPGKDGLSMTDLALNHIWCNNSIAGAAPFVFRPQGILDFMGRRVLNTYVNCVARPAEGAASNWGESGNFPFLSSLFDYLFDPPSQLPYFLAWWKHFYTSALTEIPAPGQNVFLMGGKGAGKTLTNRQIIGKSVGGFVDAAEHLTRQSGFDSEMYEVGLWCVDDETMGESSQSQANFQAMLKKIAANQQFKHNKKFEVSVMTEWMGRAICTTNLDYISSRALGSLDNTSEDKTCVFRCAAESEFKFPPRTILIKTIDKELPHMLSWLIQWEPPDLVQRDVRYGYAAYHEPTLLNQAYQSSRVAPFKELLVESLSDYFMHHPEATEWRGTTTQLIRLIHLNPLNEPVMKSLKLEQTSRYLEMLQRERLITCSAEIGPLKTRVWKFARFESELTPALTLPDSNPIVFQKLKQ